jgi:hypothetical protein
VIISPRRPRQRPIRIKAPTKPFRAPQARIPLRPALTAGLTRALLPPLEPRARTRRSQRHTGTMNPECTIRPPPTNPDCPPLRPAAALPHLTPMRPPELLMVYHFCAKVQVRSIYRMTGSVPSKRLAAGSSPAGGATFSQVQGCLQPAARSLAAGFSLLRTRLLPRFAGSLSGFAFHDLVVTAICS